MHDNAFLEISDVEAAQKFSDRINPEDIHKVLDAFAKRYCPVPETLGLSYTWTVQQIECATDVMFKQPGDLEPLYDKIIRTAIFTVNPDNIATFPGQRITYNCKKEVGTNYIIYTFHAFCKVVIRNAAMTAWRNRSRQRQREISLDYLTEALHYSFGTEDESFDTYNEYPVVLCGQTVIFTNEQLAAAILSLPERRKGIIYLYYFERHTQQEIGEMYGRCRSTTGYQIRKTLRILHGEMEVLLHEQETKPIAL